MDTWEMLTKNNGKKYGVRTNTVSARRESGSGEIVLVTISGKTMTEPMRLLKKIETRHY